MKSKRKSRSKFRMMRHCFYFKRLLPNGKVGIERVWAKVFNAKEPVTITLTEKHVIYARDHDGPGNSQNCAVAVCADAHRKAFPHPVVGPIDWFYRTAFVASKENKDGRLVQCVAYSHRSEVAKLFDTKRGLNKLLEIIKANGPITIQLDLPKKTVEKSKQTTVKSKRDKSRTRIPHRGVRLRYAYSHGGYEPQANETAAADS